MKKNAHRLLTSILTLAVVLTSVSCTGNTPFQQTSSTQSVSGSQSAEPASNADPFGKYEEPVTVKVVRTLDSTLKFDEKFPETYSLENNVWSQAYEEMLGIKLEYLWTPNGDQYTTKWTTAMASGDLPDMGWVDAATYQMLVEGGLVEDMTEVFETYASDYYKAQVEADGGVTRNFMTFDGCMLGLPLTGTTPDGINLLFIRKDWLDKVNMEVPKTIDELVSLAQAFKDAKLGGADTYGICMGPYAFAGECDWEGFLNGYGAYYNIWIKDDDGKLAYSTIQPEMREAVLRLQELCSNGLISREFAVNANIKEDLVAGKVGISYGTYWAPVASIQSQMNNDPNSEWITVPLPTIDGSPMKTQAWGDGIPSQYFFVKKGFQYPEAAVKMINLGFKLDVEDPMKYNFHEDSQIQVQQYRIAAAWEPWRNMSNTELVWEALESKDTSKLKADSLDMYNNITAYREGTLEREKIGYMLVNEAQGSSYSIIKELRENDGIVLSEYKTLAPPQLNERLTTINNDLYNAIVNVISGKDISVFDKAVEVWISSGGNDITTQVNEWYAAQ